MRDLVNCICFGEAVKPFFLSLFPGLIKMNSGFIFLILPPAQILDGSAARISIQDFFRIWGDRRRKETVSQCKSTRQPLKRSKSKNFWIVFWCCFSFLSLPDWGCLFPLCWTRGWNLSRQSVGMKLHLFSRLFCTCISTSYSLRIYLQFSWRHIQLIHDPQPHSNESEVTVFGFANVLQMTGSCLTLDWAQ